MQTDLDGAGRRPARRSETPLTVFHELDDTATAPRPTRSSGRSTPCSGWRTSPTRRRRHRLPAAERRVRSSPPTPTWSSSPTPSAAVRAWRRSPPARAGPTCRRRQRQRVRDGRRHRVALGSPCRRVRPAGPRCRPTGPRPRRLSTARSTAGAAPSHDAGVRAARPIVPPVDVGRWYAAGSPRSSSPCSSAPWSGRPARRGGGCRWSCSTSCRWSTSTAASATPSGTSSGRSACRGSCSAASSERCCRSPAPATRACSATRSSTRTCSARRPAPGSGRRWRSRRCAARRRGGWSTRRRPPRSSSPSSRSS